MKKNYLLLLITSLGLLTASCQKDTENTIPADAPRMDQICAQYKDSLMSAKDGWLLEYQPANGVGAYHMLMVFKPDSVHIKSDYNVSATNTYLDQSNVKYDIRGVILPELAFSTYSVFERIYENMGGHFEFEMRPDSAGGFWLNPIKLKDKTIRFHLQRATKEDIQLFNQKVAKEIEINQYVNDPELKYFKQLELYAGGDKRLSGTAIFDAAKNNMYFIYRESGSAKVESYPYKMSTTGIDLIKPIKLGNAEIKSLTIGSQSTPGTLPVTTTTSTNEMLTGAFVAADTSLYIYKGSANFFKDGEVQYVMVDQSSKLKTDYYERRIESLNGYNGTQLYLNWSSKDGTKNNNMLSIVLQQSGSEASFNNYMLEPVTKGEDQIYFTYTKGPSFVDYYSERLVKEVIANPNGFTIIFLGYDGYNRPYFTLVSRKDSRYSFTVVQATRRELIAN